MEHLTVSTQTQQNYQSNFLTINGNGGWRIAYVKIKSMKTTKLNKLKRTIRICLQ